MPEEPPILVGAQVSELPELATRVERLESDLAAVRADLRNIGRAAGVADADIASLQEQRRADVGLLQAFRTTQLEHSDTLKEHSRVLGLLVATQLQQTEVLNQHTGVLNQHTEVLNQHTEALARIERDLGTIPEE